MQTEQEKDSARSRDYEALLSFDCDGTTVTVPDPQKLATGWKSEKVRLLNYSINKGYNKLVLKYVFNFFFYNIGGFVKVATNHGPRYCRVFTQQIPDRPPHQAPAQ